MADISLHYRAETPLAATVGAIGELIALWRRRARDRHDLARLDARSIRDLGLSTGDVEFELNKPFWRA